MKHGAIKMWECPGEQSCKRVNTTALLPGSHPAQGMWKRKLPLMRADAVKAPSAGTGTSRARKNIASHRSQMLIAGHKGESVPTCNDCVTVL